MSCRPLCHAAHGPPRLKGEETAAGCSARPRALPLSARGERGDTRAPRASTGIGPRHSEALSREVGAGGGLGRVGFGTPGATGQGIRVSAMSSDGVAGSRRENAALRETERFFRDAETRDEPRARPRAPPSIVIHSRLPLKKERDATSLKRDEAGQGGQGRRSARLPPTPTGPGAKRAPTGSKATPPTNGHGTAGTTGLNPRNSAHTTRAPSGAWRGGDPSGPPLLMWQVMWQVRGPADQTSSSGSCGRSVRCRVSMMDRESAASGSSRNSASWSMAR